MALLSLRIKVLRLDIPAHMKYLTLSQEILRALSKNTKRCHFKKKKKKKLPSILLAEKQKGLE